MQVTENDILALERKYWEAMKKNDVETATALTKFPCIVAGPKGASAIDEATYRSMLKKSDGSKYEGIELQDAKAQIVNDTTAIITYGIEYEGKKMLDVSTWVKDGSKWACAFHSETPVQLG